MGSSRKPHPLISIPRHLRGELAFPARTPGILGWQDAADPSHLSLLGDNPGPTGLNDHGSPDRLVFGCMRTIKQWSQESAVHISPDMQIGHYYAAGNRDAVLKRATEFLVDVERPEIHPYLPPGKYSGITIGVGYDIGQTAEHEFRKDWAELARLSAGPHAPEDSRDGHAPRSTPLDRLAIAAKGRLTHDQAQQYLPQLANIEIPKQLSMKVFTSVSLPRRYHETVLALPGFTRLPTGVQVAILSLVYNRGEPNPWSRKSEANPKHGSKPGFDDLLDSRWEMKQLWSAVRTGDLVWIYWLFESMRRVWVLEKSKSARGLINRRDAELALIYPYVASDLKYEALRQRFPRWEF